MSTYSLLLCRAVLMTAVVSIVSSERGPDMTLYADNYRIKDNEVVTVQISRSLNLSCLFISETLDVPRWYILGEEQQGQTIHEEFYSYESYLILEKVSSDDHDTVLTCKTLKYELQKSVILKVVAAAESTEKVEETRQKKPTPASPSAKIASARPTIPSIDGTSKTITTAKEQGACSCNVFIGYGVIVLEAVILVAILYQNRSLYKISQDLHAKQLTVAPEVQVNIASGTESESNMVHSDTDILLPANNVDHNVEDPRQDVAVNVEETPSELKRRNGNMVNPIMTPISK